MESQIRPNEERLGLLGKFRELVLDFMAGEFGVHDIFYKDGALSGKNGMALAIDRRVVCVPIAF